MMSSSLCSTVLCSEFYVLQFYVLQFSSPMFYNSLFYSLYVTIVYTIGYTKLLFSPGLYIFLTTVASS